MIAAPLICPVYATILLISPPHVIPPLKYPTLLIFQIHRFSSLPIKQASMAKSDVEEISTSLVDIHSLDPSLNAVTQPPSF